MSEHTEQAHLIRLNPAASGLGVLISPLPRAGINPRVRLATDPAEQTRQLVDDVISILNGGEGEFIKFIETFDPAVLDDRLRGPRFKLHPAIDAGTRDVIARIATAAGSAYSVRTFADHFSDLEYGQVNQALASAYRVLYSLYLDVVVELEKSKGLEPTLYSMWMKLEQFVPNLIAAQSLIMRFVEETRLARERKWRSGATDLVERANTAQFVAHDEKEALIELRGGAILRTIADLYRRSLGDADAANLYSELLSAASKPYLRMLDIWLKQGDIVDPFEEFLIQQTSAAGAGSHVDDYWDKRYVVRAMDLPLQLSPPRIYNQLLISGKYLNVIRDCTGKALDEEKLLADVDLSKCSTIEDPQVVDTIARVYKRANSRLLHLLNEDSTLNLRGLLVSLRKLFFMYDTELFSIFALNAKEDLRKLAADVDIASLEHALNLAKDPDDPWRNFIGVRLSSESLKDAMLSIVAGDEPSQNEARDSGKKYLALDAVEYDFEVPFPLSVVISRRSIMRYQFLFRHILELRTAQEELVQAWSEQAKKDWWRFVTSNADVAHLKRRANMLRQRKLRLVNDLLYLTTVESIEPEWTAFYESIDDYTEVSQFVDAHIRFLDRALLKSLLAHPQILKIQARLLSLVRQYAKFLTSNNDAMSYVSGITELKLNKETGEPVTREEVVNWVSMSVDHYERSFTRNLQRFYDQLERYIPTNFVGGSSVVSMLQRLKAIMPEVAADTPSTAVSAPQLQRSDSAEA